jgi:hypothetical protein
MAGYRIEICGGEEMRETITSLWDEYLPGTHHGRFNWMSRGNPAGKTIWLFAYSEKTGELAGTMSVMPRYMYCAGRHLKAGILGDFMVLKKFRAFGPGLMLPKYIAMNYRSLGFDLIYTLPNDDSRKILEKSGFNHQIMLKTLVRPIRVEKYLSRYMPPLPARILGSCIDIAMKPFSLFTYATGGTDVHRETGVDSSFDELWNTIRAEQTAVIGDRSSAYLRWRFLENPQLDFKMLCLRKEKKLLGYLFYIINSDDLEIFDITAATRWSGLKLLHRAASIAGEMGCKAVFFNTGMHPGDTGRLGPKILKLCMFLDARADYNLKMNADSELRSKHWAVTRTDRNI